MINANIYYFVGLQEPSGQKFFEKNHKLYFDLYFDSKVKVIKIPLGVFKTYWRKMPKQEKISCACDGDFEKIFIKYNSYVNNPYSADNDPGQEILTGLGVKHTSMSVGDVIKVDGVYWIIAGVGYKRLMLK